MLPETSRPESKFFGFRIFFLLASFAVLSVSSMVRETLTYDEPSFFSYGHQILEKGTAIRKEAFHNSKMPVNALQALPPFLCERWHCQSTLRWFGRVLAYDEYRWWLSRSVTVGFALLLLVVVAKWSLDLYGRRGALFSLLLASFCPTILGHGHYITTDVPTASLMTLAMYAFWRFCKSPRATTYFASSLCLGLAQLTKYTAGILFFLIAASGLLHVFCRAGGSWQAGLSCCRKRVLAGMGAALGFALISLAIINSGFLWESPMTPLKDYKMGTERMKSLPSFVGNFPIPTAYGYFQGLAMTMWSEHHLDSNRGRPYFLGEAGYRRWWLYYPVALFLKSPLALWGLLLIALAKRKIASDEVIFLLFPALALFFYFTFFQQLQLGVRFLLPVLPLLYVFLGRLGGMKRGLVAMLSAWFVLSSLWYFPHWVSYFNECIGPRINAYRYLADSNLDWGQNGKELERYLANHAGEKISVNPKAPVAGKILVGANHLVGLYDPEQFRWLRDHHRPIGHVAYSWLLFDVPAPGRKVPGTK